MTRKPPDVRIFEGRTPVALADPVLVTVRITWVYFPTSVVAGITVSPETRLAATPIRGLSAYHPL